MTTTHEASAVSTGWPMPRSVASDSAAMSSARRTPESAEGWRAAITSAAYPPGDAASRRNFDGVGNHAGSRGAPRLSSRHARAHAGCAARETVWVNLLRHRGQNRGAAQLGIGHPTQPRGELQYLAEPLRERGAPP